MVRMVRAKTFHGKFRNGPAAGQAHIEELACPPRGPIQDRVTIRHVIWSTHAANTPARLREPPREITSRSHSSGVCLSARVFYYSSLSARR